MHLKHRIFVALASAALVAGILACNAPTPSPARLQTSPPTVTPYVPATVPPQDTPSPTTAAPSATSTPELPTPTHTPEPALPTDTLPPPAPTSPPTATPTTTQPAAPLEIVDTGYEIVDWQPVPGSKEWEGHLRILFQGGIAPYTSSIAHRDPQEENHHYLRWEECKGAPIRSDVWSADGQHAHRDLWIASPYCPTPTP